MSATTVGGLVAEAKRSLLGMHRAQLNVLNANISSGATSLVTTYALQNISAGMYICIDDEMFIVWVVDATSKTVTVQGAQLGTTAAAHVAGTIIEVAPRYPQPVIRDALQEDIASWPKTLYQTASVTLAVASSSLGVDLAGAPATFYDILDVVRQPSTASSMTSTDVFRTSWSQRGWRVQRNMPTANFASGTALFLEDLRSIAYNIVVTYSYPFDLSAFATDATSLLAGGVGLRASMVDIPVLGAMWRLVSGRESLRVAMEAQGESRQANEVPAGSILRAGEQFMGLRDKRIADESLKLLNEHPWKRVA